MLETALWTLIGFLGGSGVTWFVARHFYLRAAREKPEWADELVRNVVAEFRSSHPDTDPGDLVAIFERALGEKGITIDGGTY